MEAPTLYLLRRDEISDWDQTNQYSLHSKSQLWAIAEIINLHPFLREPALLELARRGDSKLLELCEKLLVANDPDDCLIAIRILAQLGTRLAIERLLQFCCSCSPPFKKESLNALATALTPEYANYFMKLITPLACTGILDITGWTPCAISSLEKLCQRKSIRVVSGKADTIFSPKGKEKLETSAKHKSKLPVLENHQEIF